MRDSPTVHDPALARLVRSFESLTPDRIGDLLTHYAQDASFVDPFNHVRGHAAIGSVFRHMYTQLREPSFQVLSGVRAGDIAFLEWRMDFEASRRGNAPAIVGCTRLRFDAEDRVVEHVDHWDAAAQVYERVPVLGALLRMARRRLAAPQPGPGSQSPP